MTSPHVTSTWPGALAASSPIAATATLGAVHLTVSDLERSRAFWTGVVGLRSRVRDDGALGLHAGGADLVVLVEEPGAVPAVGRTGLFHVALLLPTRGDLARWLAHAARDRVRLEGLSDHWVSEAIYLRDPDHHGIEIYADRPRQEWVNPGMTTQPLDVTDLLAALGGPPPDSPYEGMPDGTRVGHVHLHVADLPASTGFYVDTLGFDRTLTFGDQADFWSAGGYHHHLAGNLWAGPGAPPPEPGTAALRHLTLLLPGGADVERAAARVADAGGEVVDTGDGLLVRDPAQNAVLLTVSP